MQNQRERADHWKTSDFELEFLVMHVENWFIQTLVVGLCVPDSYYTIMLSRVVKGFSFLNIVFAALREQCSRLVALKPQKTEFIIMTSL